MEDMIAEGDQVILRWMWHGTHTGDLLTPMMRLHATGKQVTVTGITIFRVASGRVVETWNQSDRLGMYQQLGLIPVPEPVG
jgi:predicted ester cyclase